jgi:hypothetical protein
MKYDRLWERLIEYVDEWASAREVPGGIEVTFEHPPGVTRTVEVVLTPADWDGYISTIFGTGDPRATPLREQVLATPAEVRYLVYDSRIYDWEPSPTRELPPEDEVDHGPGEWVVMDDDGNVVDRFRDFLEREGETGPGG